ncbi:MAG TPA: IS66 family transposase [Candidatus Babeliales bacterium]|nr:IS66 family transposase [Candidatus Babeliales bacterium]
MDKKDLRIQELERENAELKKTITKLLARIEELERRLGLNSGNSSKPPSSDGLRKASKTRSLRDSNSNKFGGQVGHKGNTLNQTDNPDATINYDPIACSACGCSLENVVETGVIEKQEVDIVLKKQVTAHKASIKICSCGKKSTGIMPEHIKAPVQFSANIRAISVYLTNQFISKSRIANLFQDLFGVTITDTTLMLFDEECAQKLTLFNDVVLDAIKKAAIKYADETGMRVAGKNEWVHLISTTLLTHYRLDEKRGSLLQGIVGKIVHDHWKPYFTLDEVIHVLCNAHHLRELRALIELDKEVWAQHMYDLLKNASKLVNPLPAQQQNISEQYDQIIEEGLKYHESLGQFKAGSRKKRPGHNLLIRLRDFKTETLRFLYDDEVPFTNNAAERDLRMVKLKQKVSGSFRKRSGAKVFLAIRSFVSTIQKQGKNILEYIKDVFNDTFDISSLVPT